MNSFGSAKRKVSSGAAPPEISPQPVLDASRLLLPKLMEKRPEKARQFNLRARARLEFANLKIAMSLLLQHASVMAR